MRIIEGEYDDRPLPGPWNRRRPEYPGPLENDPGPAEAAPAPLEKAPGPVTGAGEPEDVPLPGPWNRRREPEPARGRPETETAPAESGNENANESRAVSAAAMQYNPEAIPEEPGFCGEKQQCPGRGRRRAYIDRLFSPSGIYAGIVTAEVLGGRGGRFGCRRRPVVRSGK